MGSQVLRLVISSAIASLFFVGCTKDEPVNTSNDNTSRQAPPATSTREPEPIKDPLIGKVLRLTQDSIYLLDSASTDGQKIINKKATAVLGTTEYITVDTSCMVEVLERIDHWVKVRVVDPTFLSESHIGWTETIVLEGFTEKLVIPDDSYTIVKRKRNGDLETIYVVYNKPDPTPKIARALIAKIREHVGKANIYVFDDEAIISTFEKYPLTKDAYLRVADRFICDSTFDAPLAVAWYPYQDFQYKEYGGTNWKKEPIQ